MKQDGNHLPVLGSWIELDQGLIKAGLFQPASVVDAPLMRPVLKILTDPE